MPNNNKNNNLYLHYFCRGKRKEEKKQNKGNKIIGDLQLYIYKFVNQCAAAKVGKLSSTKYFDSKPRALCKSARELPHFFLIQPRVRRKRRSSQKMNLTMTILKSLSLTCTTHESKILCTLTLGMANTPLVTCCPVLFDVKTTYMYFIYFICIISFCFFITFI